MMKGAPLSPSADLQARWRRFKLCLLGLLPALVLMALSPGEGIATPLAITFVWLFVTGAAWRSLTTFPCPRCGKPFFARGLARIEEAERWLGDQRGAFLQALYSAGIFDPYAYQRSIRAEDIMLNQFLQGNVEQQGQTLQDYVYGIETGANVKKYSRIADFVRRETIGEVNACF